VTLLWLTKLNFSSGSIHLGVIQIICDTFVTHKIESFFRNNPLRDLSNNMWHFWDSHVKIYFQNIWGQTGGQTGGSNGVNGVIASPIIISSHPPPPHPMGGPFRVRFQFSNLDNIDSMITFPKSMFPYSMLNTFPKIMSVKKPIFRKLFNLPNSKNQIELKKLKGCGAVSQIIWLTKPT